MEIHSGQIWIWIFSNSQVSKSQSFRVQESKVSCLWVLSLKSQVSIFSSIFQCNRQWVINNVVEANTGLLFSRDFWLTLSLRACLSSACNCLFLGIRPRCWVPLASWGLGRSIFWWMRHGACSENAMSFGSKRHYFSTKPGSIETNPTLVVEVSNVKLISI